MSAALAATDSIARGGHVIPLGARVIVTRNGVVQPWGDVVVVHHDRNRTYRLRFTNDTFVTAHEAELTLDAPF